MLVFRPIVDQQQELGSRQALDETTEQGLRLCINPVQILEDQQQRLFLALAQEHPLEGVEGTLAALRGIELEERAILRQGVEERQQRRDRVLESRIERQRLAGHLGADGTCIVVILYVAVTPE